MIDWLIAQIIRFGLLCLFVPLLVGCLIGYLIGYGNSKNKSVSDCIDKTPKLTMGKSYNIFKSTIVTIFTDVQKCSKFFARNLQDVVLFFTFAIAFSIFLMPIIGKSIDKEILGVTLSFFSSFIFSWLLTKKSSQIEFEKAQTESAKKSYRHLAYIIESIEYMLGQVETMVTDCKKDGAYGSSQYGERLQRIRDSLMHINGGVNAAAADWKDIMDKVEQEEKKEVLATVKNVDAQINILFSEDDSTDKLEDKSEDVVQPSGNSMG